MAKKPEDIQEYVCSECYTALEDDECPNGSIEANNLDSDSFDKLDLGDALWHIVHFGLEDYQKDNDKFIISGWLREL